MGRIQQSVYFVYRVGENMQIKNRRGQTGLRFIIYLFGLLVMMFGLVLIILADLGPAPWDVLHVGLYYSFGLTLGTWSIIVGIVILSLSAIIAKAFPKFGAFLNMILCGIFIDMYMMIPFLETPSTFIGKIIMFVLGLIINGYGMGIYISAQLGTGPRDSLMMAVTSMFGWKVRNVRIAIEVLALSIGWLLGGPLFWGTLVYGIAIGLIAGFALPQCQYLTDQILGRFQKDPHSTKYLSNF